MDRLAEEGIESVQDLAMKEIPALLVKTRFDTPLLLSWVDRALLCNQVGSAIPLFRGAHILHATQLVHLARRKAGREDVLASLEQTRKNLQAWTPTESSATDSSQKPVDSISHEVLENIVKSLEMGPNLHYLNNYWKNVNGLEPSQSAPSLEEYLRDTGQQAGGSSRQSEPGG